MSILNRLLASFVKTRETSLICNPSYSIPLTVTASHNIYLKLQFASIAIPVLLKHPFKFLESNIFHKVCYFTGISFQNQQLFLLCVHSRKKPIFFMLLIRPLSKIPRHPTRCCPVIQFQLKFSTVFSFDANKLLICTL